MAKLQLNHTTKYSVQEIYDILADIETYPEFMPNITKVNIIDKEEQDDGSLKITLDLTINGKMVNETQRSDIILHPKEYTFFTEKTGDANSPLKRIENKWKLIETDSGCEIDFNINIEMKVAMIEMMVKPMMGGFFKKVFVALEERADSVYG